eukprot:TRINITY_DN121_c1_g1_i1.p1 TRINITY_DN121_c1_g1~~TRINITY_DN121_c1_g1_i1.p1  ORF type:complete len:690 (+),score=334.50 TRINITY_DN121_c1_g1_i1:54-2072(+)
MENFRFHHTQMYVHSLKPMAEYKALEESLTALSKKGSFDPFSGQASFLAPDALPARIAEARQHWTEMVKDAKNPESYKSQDQDIVEQLIVGTGWRVTAEYIGAGTRSVLVCTEDPCGAKMVVTTKTGDSDEGEVYAHFRASRVQTFHDAHIQREGISVLSFEVAPGSLEGIHGKYTKLHPNLLVAGIQSFTDNRTVQEGEKQQDVSMGSFKCLDVYAYYAADGKAADKGTVLRFTERTGSFANTPGFGNPHGVLPGLKDVPATFDGTSCSAYSDHWVSNVIDRNGFLKTLEDTLGFTPKVDFNAGVVAAGEAIIESTVTGNTSSLDTQDLKVAFEDQSQVYLPINNALSKVGHVAGYIDELGQGVQHLACRVKNLTSFIERVSNYRKITGQGFSFLRIPRSYYGRLSASTLVKSEVSQAVADAVCAALIKAGWSTPAGVVVMDITADKVKALEIAADLKTEFDAKIDTIVALVLRSRYENIYSLLRDLIHEDEYLRIVENQVLVDIQGNDILYQIFTSNILQKNAGEESPFLEFIQRVCASHTGKKIRPGCGGFGIRNFLTLFLSIEVSKAMLEFETASAKGDAKLADRAQRMVNAFTDQLDESNPILTSISDAMTLEADSLEAAEKVDGEEKAKHLKIAEEQRKVKEEGNEKLKVTSTRYKDMLKAIRQEA